MYIADVTCLAVTGDEVRERSHLIRRGTGSVPRVGNVEGKGELSSEEGGIRVSSQKTEDEHRLCCQKSRGVLGRCRVTCGFFVCVGDIDQKNCFCDWHPRDRGVEWHRDSERGISATISQEFESGGSAEQPEGPERGRGLGLGLGSGLMVKDRGEDGLERGRVAEARGEGEGRNVGSGV